MRERHDFEKDTSFRGKKHVESGVDTNADVSVHDQSDKGLILSRTVQLEQGNAKTLYVTQ